MKRFKYNGVIYETPNLEKKLKRMKISLDKVELLDDSQEVVVIDDNTPQWKTDGYIKHEFINDDPDSSEYKWRIIGFHKPGDKVDFNGQRGWNKEKVIYIDDVIWQEK